MYNSQMPSSDDLPTSRQLIRSTAIAIGVAGALLVTVVLPSEYAIDPTGVGRLIGLTEMGEVKMQLAQEAAADVAADESMVAEPVASEAVTSASPAVSTANRRDRMEVTLAPGEAAEIKVAASQGARIEFEWWVEGGHVNFDAHGDPVTRRAGFYHGYGKGRASTGDRGALVAAFDGTHGWYWRNRSDATVTVTLQTSGAYNGIRRVV